MKKLIFNPKLNLDNVYVNVGTITIKFSEIISFGFDADGNHLIVLKTGGTVKTLQKDGAEGVENLLLSFLKEMK